MLVELMDGRARSAGELARRAQISPAAASMHLSKLLRGELLAVEKQGRHRYYRLANSRVGGALEALGLIATRPAPRSQPLSPRQAALAHARTCYDHLAGAVAVALCEALVRERIISLSGERDYRVTRHGIAWLSERFDIDVGALERTRRATALRCMDWTERRPHMAGALGAELLVRMTNRRWVAVTSQPRALRITSRGRRAFQRLGIDYPDP